MLTRWNTRLFQWNTCANPSVPDQSVTQRPESHNAHVFSVIGDGRKILEHWNTHLRQSSSGPAGPSSPPRCHEGVWRRSLRRHLSLHLFKKCSSECSSVPVRRRPRRIALKTCANEVSGDYRFCILEHSPAQRVFQPVPAFQQGVSRAVSEGGGRWARRPAGSNRTGAGSRSAPPPRAGAAPVARRRRLAQSGVPVFRSVPGRSSVPGSGLVGRRPF